MPLIFKLEIIFLIHELGHVAVRSCMGIWPKKIAYKSWHKIPLFLGIEYRIDESDMTKNQIMGGSIAGPLANVALGLAFLHGSRGVLSLSTLSLFFAAVNLLPFKGTDGWRIAKCQNN